MFIHKNRLEHLLTPAQYFSPQQHQLEVQRLFLPSWQVLATRADLPNDGDFITLELFGRPLLLRNFEGEIRAFLNVCAHRHCRLTHLPRGNNPRFRCQYHGWEYGKEGRPTAIPDARCFRPWDRENARLKTYRTETCGELVFVCLQDDGPSLAEYLGPYHSYFAENFTAPFRQCWRWNRRYDSNWKIVVENSLESYHVPCLHQKTFGKMTPEANCEHELNERYTWFKAHDDSAVARFLGWSAQRLGIESSNDYMHYHLHPSMTFSGIAMVRMVQIVLPTSATTCLHKAWLFTARGHDSGLIGRLLGSLLVPVVTLFERQVKREDMAIFPAVQRGMEASTSRGVIGTREERIYVFQKYVLDRCG
jgi:choline monooxygenase